MLFFHIYHALLSSRVGLRISMRAVAERKLQRAVGILRSGPHLHARRCGILALEFWSADERHARILELRMAESV